jgi:hypothetical protein
LYKADYAVSRDKPATAKHYCDSERCGLREGARARRRRKRLERVGRLMHPEFADAWDRKTRDVSGVPQKATPSGVELVLMLLGMVFAALLLARTC